MSKTSAPLLAVLVLLCLGGCASPPTRAVGTVGTTATTATAAAPNDLGPGYALLFTLLDKQKNVDKLLLIKKEKDDLHEVIKAVARISSQRSKELEAFAKRDPALPLKATALPVIEIQARDSIEKAEARELLRARKRDFELRLLLTQLEGLRYGSHLARTLMRHENNGERRVWLEGVMRELDELRLRAFALVTSRYQQSF